MSQIEKSSEGDSAYSYRDFGNFDNVGAINLSNTPPPLVTVFPSRRHKAVGKETGLTS